MASTHRKGVTFEREVSKAFETAGFQVFGLEATGDHLAVRDEGRVIHVECKRHERLRVPEWLDQLERDAPRGVDRVLVFRQSRQRAYAVVPLDQYLARLS